MVRYQFSMIHSNRYLPRGSAEDVLSITVVRNAPSNHTTSNDSQNLVNLLKIIQEKLDWVNINRVLADDQNDHFVDLSGTQIERNKKRTRNTLRFT